MHRWKRLWNVFKCQRTLDTRSCPIWCLTCPMWALREISSSSLSSSRTLIFDLTGSKSTPLWSFGALVCFHALFDMFYLALFDMIYRALRVVANGPIQELSGPSSNRFDCSNFGFDSTLVVCRFTTLIPEVLYLIFFWCSEWRIVNSNWH